MRFSYFICLACFAVTLFGLSKVSAAEDQQDYTFVILPGDVLHINVWGEETLNLEAVVLADGTITYPLAGTINAREKTPQDLQKIIGEKLQPFIPEAVVTVSVKAPLGHTASIIGQVRQPGEIVLNSQTGVMEALSRVGGLTAYADEGDIIVLRKSQDGEKIKIPYPYKSIAQGRDLDKDINLMPGDVVVVPTSGLF